MRNTFGLLIFVSCFSQAIFSFAGGDKRQPDETVLGSIEDEYGPVLFGHKMHSTLAGDCGLCHHHTGSDETSACLQCHNLGKTEFRKAVGERFLPCRQCHSGIKPDKPRMPSLKVAYHRQCFKCHRGMEGVGEGPAGCVALCHKEKGAR